MEILARANGAGGSELAVHAATAFVGGRADGVELLAQLAFGGAARVVAVDAGVALLAFFALVIAAEGIGFGAEAVRRLGLEDGVDGAAAARGEDAVVGLHAIDRVRVHDVGAALPGRGRALGGIRVVLGTPIVAKFVSGDQIGFARENASASYIFRAAQTRVQV